VRRGGPEPRPPPAAPGLQPARAGRRLYPRSRRHRCARLALRLLKAETLLQHLLTQSFQILGAAVHLVLGAERTPLQVGEAGARLRLQRLQLRPLARPASELVAERQQRRLRRPNLLPQRRDLRLPPPAGRHHPRHLPRPPPPRRSRSRAPPPHGGGPGCARSSGRAPCAGSRASRPVTPALAPAPPRRRAPPPPPRRAPRALPAIRRRPCAPTAWPRAPAP